MMTEIRPRTLVPASLPRPPVAEETLDFHPRAQIGNDHRLMHFVEEIGGAAGGAVGAGVGAAAGFGKGVAEAVSTPAGRSGLEAAAIAGGATAGVLGGVAAGILAGAGAGPIAGVIAGVAAAAVGAAAGAAAGAAGSMALDGAHAAAREAPAGWAAGKHVGHEAVQGAVGAGVDAIEWMGAHNRILEMVGLWLLRHSQTEPGGHELINFHPVDKGVFRSAQPGPLAWADLKAKGYKTVINLRDETDYEKDAVQKAGLNGIYFPESPLGPPTVKQAIDFLKMATNPANQPVLFHCFDGVDRTGCMAACYRIAVQGWSREQALKEALQLGMVQELQGDKIRFIEHFDAAWQEMKRKGIAPTFP